MNDSLRYTIYNPYNNNYIDVDIIYDVSYYEGIPFEVNISEIITDEGVNLVPYIDYMKLLELESKVAQELINA